MAKVISIDAETNGLRGQAFMLAGVAYEEGREISRFVGRCSIEGNINPWVAENVLPSIEGIEEDHDSYESLLRAFMAWHQEFQQWNSWDAKEEFQTLWHMGHVVETKLFDDAFKMGIIGEFESPYCPIEVATLLQAKGFSPDSVDGYVKEHNLELPEVAGGTHNALYDCIVAAAVFHHLQD
jgi:hypothetical protein